MLALLALATLDARPEIGTRRRPRGEEISLGYLGPIIPIFLRVRLRRLLRTPRFRENWRIALHYRELLCATTQHG